MARLELKFKAHPRPILIETSYDGSASGGPDQSVTATYPAHYRWSRGPKALCLLLIEARIRELIGKPILLAPRPALATIFNLLKKRDVIDATQWPNAIFGHDAVGRPQISSLLENKGTDQYPSPQLNQNVLRAECITVILDGADISNQTDALRALLGDLAAQLRLAPDQSDPPQLLESSVGAPPETTGHDLSGIWLSEYEYPSQDPEPGIYASQKYVMFRQSGSVIAAESFANAKGSELKLSLGVHMHNIIVGTWMERTSKGTLYHGSLNLIIEPAGMLLRGKWLGFDRRYNINTGPWRFVLQSREITAKAKRKYEMLHANPAARALSA